MKIRLAAYLQPDSIVDGEGIRTVIWFQGCLHNCVGCHNPETHDLNGGFSVNIDNILKDKDNYLMEMDKLMKETGVKRFIFAVTDIIKNGSYILYDNKSEDVVKKAFNIKKIEQGVFLKGVVSRKQQIVPAVLDAID